MARDAAAAAVVLHPLIAVRSRSLALLGAITQRGYRVDPEDLEFVLAAELDVRPIMSAAIWRGQRGNA